MDGGAVLTDEQWEIGRRLVALRAWRGDIDTQFAALEKEFRESRKAVSNEIASLENKMLLTPNGRDLLNTMTPEKLRAWAATDHPGYHAPPLPAHDAEGETVTSR